MHSISNDVYLLLGEGHVIVISPSHRLTTAAYIHTSNMCIEFYYYIQEPESTILNIVLTAENGTLQILKVPKMHKSWTRYFVKLPAGIYILNLEIQKQSLKEQQLESDTGTTISIDDISMKQCTQFGMYGTYCTN